MRPILTSDTVCLAVDLNELQLHDGDTGRVRSSWHYPNAAYEVEFPHVGGGPIRILLLQDQIRPVEAGQTLCLHPTMIGERITKSAGSTATKLLSLAKCTTR